MKKKIAKIITVLVIAILSASVLCACNEKGGSTSNGWTNVTENTKPEEIKSDIVSAEDWSKSIQVLTEKGFFQLLQESESISNFSSKATLHISNGVINQTSVAISKYTKDALYSYSEQNALQEEIYLIIENALDENQYTVIARSEEDPTKWVKDEELSKIMSEDLNTPPLAQYKDSLIAENFQYNEETGSYHGSFLLYKDQPESRYEVELRFVASFPVYVKFWSAYDPNAFEEEILFYDINKTTIEVPDYE